MPNDYVLMTDDSCDLPRDFLKEHDIPVIELSYVIDGVQYKGNDMSPKEFYSLVRSGKMPITAQVNVEEALVFIEPYLKEGRDLIYIAFTSGLSGTYSSGAIAARELSEKYPERKVITVDSLCASMGQGLMVYKANELREKGASIEEVERFVINTRDHIGHSVMVEDLMHLHRGGRVSKTSAIAGSMLGIKPMLHIDLEGHLVPCGKVRGRKQALNETLKQLQTWGAELCENDIFMVSHSDCEEDAVYVAELVKKTLGIDKYMINYIGPVIGSHTGSGTVALFAMVKKKMESH